jgi:hypothetical protein
VTHNLPAKQPIVWRTPQRATRRPIVGPMSLQSTRSRGLFRLNVGGGGGFLTRRLESTDWPLEELSLSLGGDCARNAYAFSFKTASSVGGSPGAGPRKALKQRSTNRSCSSGEYDVCRVKGRVALITGVNQGTRETIAQVLRAEGEREFPHRLLSRQTIDHGKTLSPIQADRRDWSLRNRVKDRGTCRPLTGRFHVTQP